MAFPIFAYLIAEGFRHSSDPLKFLSRLGIFAIISEPFYDWAIRGAASPLYVDFLRHTNIFYTLALGGAAIMLHKYVLDETGSVGKAIVPSFLFMVLAWLLTTDYGAYGVAFIFFMYVIKPLPVRLGAMAVFCMWQHVDLIGWMLVNDAVEPLYVMMVLATLVPVVLVFFYNGQRGRSLKWFFYASYPVHLGILAGLGLVFL